MSLVATRTALVRPFSPPGSTEFQTSSVEIYTTQDVTPPDWARAAEIIAIGGGAPGQVLFEVTPTAQYGSAGGCTGEFEIALVALVGGVLKITIGAGGTNVQDPGTSLWTSNTGGSTIVRSASNAVLVEALGGRPCTRHLEGASNEFLAASRPRRLGNAGGQIPYFPSGNTNGGSGGAGGWRGQAGRPFAINGPFQHSGEGEDIATALWLASASTAFANAGAPTGVVPAQAGGGNWPGRAGGGAGAGGGGGTINNGVRSPGGRGASGGVIIKWIS